MTTEREKQLQQEIVQLLIEMLNPTKIILFGSRSKGRHCQTADFDIALPGTRPDITIQQKLSEQLDALLGLYKIDIVYLDEVESAFKDIILKTGTVLYETGN